MHTTDLMLAIANKSFLRLLVEGAEAPGAIIVLLSVVAVAILVEQFRTVRRATLAPPAEIDAARETLEGRRFKDCIFQLQHSRSMFGQTLLAALKQGRHGFTAMSEIARDTSDLWTNRLMRRAEYLHVLGHLGPLMGLLGTVLGMIRAFGKMQETHGGYRPEDLAGGISLALVNTFLGLALAVLALGMFGVCRNRIEALTSEAAATVQGLLEHFRPASGEMTIAPRTPRIDTTTPVPPPPPAATPRPYSLRGATGLR